MSFFTVMQFIVAQGFKFSHFMQLVFTYSFMTSWTRVRRVTKPKALLAQYKRYTDKSHLPLSLVEIFVNHDSRVRAIVDRMYIGLGGHAELASNH